jgi:hypothetical protein
MAIICSPTCYSFGYADIVDEESRYQTPEHFGCLAAFTATVFCPVVRAAAKSSCDPWWMDF